MALTDEQKLDLVILNGMYNYTYQEIADEMNNRYGLDLSATQVGDRVRTLAQLAEARGDGAFDELVMKAYVEKISIV